jgi:hypothetical protein
MPGTYFDSLECTVHVYTKTFLDSVECMVSDVLYIRRKENTP